MCRILLAGIRYLGAHPCPRCLVTMDQIGELGTKWDNARRDKTARVDTTALQHEVESARRFMFELGNGPTSAAVDGVLGSKSRVPTRVSIFISHSEIQSTEACSRTHFPPSFNNLDSTIT